LNECRERQLRAITPAYTQNSLDDSGFEMRRIATGESTYLIEALPASLARYALCDDRHYRRRR
jgi:hypothetical protein